ncbi:MAG: Mrp/NBP35 family ATP-binding protein [Thermoanaerobaculia bacterium]|nr:Mrp/NBP35 family ATP-binding protein [Thermoanaerobaculia bacterium]
MSDSLEAQVLEKLRDVKFPGMSRDIVSFGFVQGVQVDGSRVTVQLRIQTQNRAAAEEVKANVSSAVSAVPGVERVSIEADITRPPTAEESAAQAIARDPRLIPEVKSVVAVASGKGGVGKSTVAANLAVALGQLGHSVGLLDADIYGPSIPLMMGLSGRRPQVADGGNRLLPFEVHGVRVMSLGFILEVDTPVIWRGPMVMKAIEQLLGDVEWGALDYLVVDLPPGTGDAQLTLTQKVPLSGAVIVTTPQDVALIDARKGLAMFGKVNVPVLGIIENMSGFACPHCGTVTDVFKKGGGERTARELGCAYLGGIPLDPAIAEGGDAGTPITVASPDGPHAASFRAVAEAVVAAAAGERPRLTIQ